MTAIQDDNFGYVSGCYALANTLQTQSSADVQDMYLVSNSLGMATVTGLEENKIELKSGPFCYHQNT